MLHQLSYHGSWLGAADLGAPVNRFDRNLARGGPAGHSSGNTLKRFAGRRPMAGRGAFNSRIGFMMAAVGSAVGLGNLWRFPYLASTNGGASFLILYLILLFVIGIPALLAELSLGRRTARNAIDAFGEDGKRRRWEGAGYLAALGSILLLSYYSVIAGWSVRYMFDSLLALTSPPAFFGGAGAAASYFTGIAEGPEAVLSHLVFMGVTLAIVIRGVSRGIEKANLIMMPILFISVIGLVVYANLQTGAAAGRDFYLEPDFSEVRGGTISNAAGQTFFSIGLGLGTMLTYSSYLSRDNDLQRTGLMIGLADTGVAVLAGLMVFPLIFSQGLVELVNPDNAGSVGGLFIVIPTAFSAIGDSLGTFLAGSFFVLLTFAAVSSAISLLEVPVSFVIDRKPDWGRPRAVFIVGLPIYIFGLLSAIDLDFLTQVDYLVSRVILIAGGLLLAIYVGWVRPDILDELDVGLSGRSYAGYFRPVIRYVLPALLGVLTVLGVLGYLVDTGLLEATQGSWLHELTS